MTWQYYHRLEDINSYLDYLAQTYPDIVSVQTIGNSVMGQPLKMIKISSGDPNAKALWIDGGNSCWSFVFTCVITSLSVVFAKASYSTVIKNGIMSAMVVRI